MNAVVTAPKRLVHGVTTFVRFLGAALGLFDWVIPRFRWKTALVFTLEMLAAMAAGVSWTLLVPFIHHLTGGTTQGLPEGTFGDLYRYFREQLTLLTVLYVVFGAVLLKNGLTLASLGVHYRMATNLSHELRARVFAAYIQSDLKFFERAKDGQFINVFNNEIHRTQKILTVWRRAISGSLTALVYLMLLFLVSPQVTWLFLAGGSLLLLALMRFYYLLRENGFAVTRLMERINSKLAEVIRCFVLIKSVGTEDREHGEFERWSRRYADAEFTHGIVAVVPGMVIETAAYVALLVAVSYIYVTYVSAGVVNPFVVISYLIFASKFVDSATIIAGTVSQLVQESSAFESIRQALEVRPVQEIRYGERPVEPSPQPIEVLDASFAHDGQVVLDGCSFKVGSGELVAIVGPSGSGKSTLALILAGLYRPQRGEVRIGGAPLSDYRREALVRLIGYQPQEPRLVEGTIRENLVYGLPGIPPDFAMDTVLREAHLGDLLEKKEQQLQAGVGERGGGLSGGERQRLAFARILLREPGILILDEITSALDLATERVVLDGLASLRGKKTVVFITHRLRSATIADRILVLDDGRIVEEGTYDELLARGGYFFLLSRSQP